MTEFSKLRPIVVAVSIASAVAFSSAALADWAPMNNVTPISPEAVKMNAALDQNQGGVVEGIRNRPDWVERINVSGLLNVDLSFQNNFPRDFTRVLEYVDSGESGNLDDTRARHHRDRSANDLGLADAALFVDAKVNDWVNTHVSLYWRQGDRINVLRQFRDGMFNDGVRVDEAYFTIGNLEQNPFFLRAGRMYLPFGKYQHYTVTDTLTQLLSETRATAVQVGAVSNFGLSGSVFGFRGLQPAREHEHETPSNEIRIRNWGANIAYAQDYGNWMFDVGAGYLSNMADVNFINWGLNQYNRKVGGLDLHGEVGVGPFDGGVRYVTALDRFSRFDILDNNGRHGAKPSAYTIDAGYTFDWMYHQRIGLTYQHSNQAKNLGYEPVVFGMPKQRYGADWQINLLSRTDLNFELGRDVVYDDDRSNGSDRRHNSTYGTVRLSVAFA